MLGWIRATSLTLAFAGSTIAAAADTAPKGGPEGLIAQPVGATWIRAMKDSGSWGSGTSRTTFTRLEKRVWQGKEVFPVQQSDNPTLLQTTDGSFLGFVNGEVPVVTFDPPASYDWPLTVGKSWTRKWTTTIHGSLRTFPVEERGQVEAYEDVVVPAGTFKAFRVHTTDSMGNENLNWFSTELGIHVKQKLMRTANHLNGPGVRETEIVSQTIRK